MDWTFGGIPDWLITTAVAMIVGVAVWLRRESLGLGDARVATRKEKERASSERSKVVELQERRIKLLEEEVASLTRRVDYLTSENESLHRLLKTNGTK